MEFVLAATVVCGSVESSVGFGGFDQGVEGVCLLRGREIDGERLVICAGVGTCPTRQLFAVMFLWKSCCILESESGCGTCLLLFFAVVIISSCAPDVHAHPAPPMQAIGHGFLAMIV